MNETLIGTTLGGYQILEEIGQGGMASVYRAQQISMHRYVAIKVLPPQFSRQSSSLERFKQEASIVARLEHRAIVPVHDYGEHEGMPYIVMRYMDGGSVDELLAKGPIPPEKTLTILEQIAPALDYAHREGVLHRDLKPSNILLDANGDAYITDFGIARILGSNTKLTTTGVVGTPSYMSPEQAQGHDLDGRSDIYALGVVLFEMLTGIRPFEGDSPYNVAVKHVTEAPPSPCEINPKLPRSVEQVLYKVLSKSREARYQTAVELANALRMALEQPAAVGLSTEGLIETERSLNEALRAGAARRQLEASQPVVARPATPPPLRAPRPPAPQIQVMPAYEPSLSRAFTGAIQARRRKRRASGWASWLTWTVIALVISGLLLASVFIAIYYIMNSGDSASEKSGSMNYEATAIFKLTATKQAIERTFAPTIPVTNTPRSTDAPPFADPGTTLQPTSIPGSDDMTPDRTMP